MDLCHKDRSWSWHFQYYERYYTSCNTTRITILRFISLDFIVVTILSLPQRAQRGTTEELSYTSAFGLMCLLSEWCQNLPAAHCIKLCFFMSYLMLQNRFTFLHQHLHSAVSHRHSASQFLHTSHLSIHLLPTEAYYKVNMDAGIFLRNL